MRKLHGVLKECCSSGNRLRLTKEGLALLSERFWRYSFLILLGLVVAWLVAFPVKPSSRWNLEDIVMEASIWGAVFFSFLIFPRKWTLLLFWGWFTLLFANTVDLLDEFTSEPKFFDTVLEGLLWVAGWLIIIVSFHRENLALEKEKEIDSLTGLLNRYFLERKFPGIFRELIHKKSLVTFIFADLDGLKEINDRFSHQAGDLVLEEALYEADQRMYREKRSKKEPLL